LLKRLEEGRQRAMTLISAPAGYGKSILAGQWLEACQGRSAWLSLDEGDNDLRVFLRYLLEAIRQTLPALPLRSTSLLQAAVLPPVKVLSHYLLNDLEQLDAPLMLVLDDYHRISLPSIHDLFRELLQHPAPLLHLVLLTRSDPPLSVNHLFAHGQLTKITKEELRFSLPETRLLLERILHAEIDEQTASALETTMEGWVTGLRLAALSMGREQDPARLVENIADDSSSIQEYLIGEVLSQAPPAFARLLMESSLLDRFCAPLCDVLHTGQNDLDTAGQVDGQAFIEWLETTHLFVIPLDERHEWFRYHHLFQQFLQWQLELRRSAGEIAGLYIRASEWCAEQGLIAEAIRYALAGRDVERAVLFVERHRQAILNVDQEYVLEKWLALLPGKVKQQRPGLLLAQAWVYRYQFRLADIFPLLAQIEALLVDQPVDEPLQAEIDFFHGYCAFFQGNSARSLECLSQALERAPSTYYLLRGETEIVLGLAGQMEGRPVEIMPRPEKILLHRHALTTIRKTRVLAAPVFLKIIAARFDDLALLYARHLYDAAVEGAYDYAKAWSFCLQGLIYSARHAPDAALPHFQQVVELRYVVHTRAAIDSLAGLSFTYQLTRRTEEADAAMAQLLDFARSFSDPAVLALAQSCQARLAVMQGDLEVALRWLETIILLDEVMVWWLEIPAVTACRVLVAEGSTASLQEAEQRLQQLVQQNQKQHNSCHLVESLTLLSLTHAGQDRLDEAVASLERAIVLAEPGGFMRPFIESGAPMADLLNRLRDRKNESRFIERILSVLTGEEAGIQLAPELSSHPETNDSVDASGRPAAGSEAPPRRQASAANQAVKSESLTNREIEVLELLGQRFYNREIAEQLGIALDTVKNHLKNIYKKLRVNGRREAEAKARELGILPPHKK
jgi:LuxR family maltose regulon positive regulatory protein